MPNIPFRGLFPPNGQRYELFECSVLVLALAFFWYIVTGPSDATATGLYRFIDIRNPRLWGTLIGLLGCVGIVASYWQRSLRVGFLIVVVGLSLWAMVLMGASLTAGSPKVFGSALVFAWVARRLWHESGVHE